MRHYLGMGLGLLALLLAVAFGIAGAVAPFGARADRSGPALVLALTYLILSVATFGHSVNRTTWWAALGVAIGCSGLVVAAYLYSRQAMLFTWGSSQTFAVIGLITLWHAAGLKIRPSESSSQDSREVRGGHAPDDDNLENDV